jgi:hypothetical protein
VLTESPLYGVPVEVIAEKCGVHPDTARRWKRTGNVPPAAVIAIRALYEHDLGAISGPWAGWSVRGGELVSPQGDRFTPGLVLAGKYHRQRCAELERAVTKIPDGAISADLFATILEES